MLDNPLPRLESRQGFLRQFLSEKLRRRIGLALGFSFPHQAQDVRQTLLGLHGCGLRIDEAHGPGSNQKGVQNSRKALLRQVVFHARRIKVGVVPGKIHERPPEAIEVTGPDGRAGKLLRMPIE